MSRIHFAFLEQTSKDQLFHLQDEVIPSVSLQTPETPKFSNYIFCFSTSNFSLYSNLNFSNVAGFVWKARSLMDKFD
jgi:hypothetical protein